jgi:hypothetical protein
LERVYTALAQDKANKASREGDTLGVPFIVRLGERCIFHPMPPCRSA